MRNIKLLVAGICAAVLVTGCGVTQDGFSSNSLQKRKYTKGFYVSKRSHLKSKEDNSKNEVLVKEQDVTTEEVAVLKKKEIEAVVNNNHTVAQQRNHSEVKSIEKREKVSEERSVNAVQSSTTTSNEKSAVSVNKNSAKEMKAVLKKHKDQSGSSFADDLLIICIILCFLIPPLAVGIWTNIDWMKVLISFLLTCLFVLPGIIYSLLVVLDKI